MRHRDQPFTTAAHLNIYSRLAERKGRGWEKKSPSLFRTSSLGNFDFQPSMAWPKGNI